MDLYNAYLIYKTQFHTEKKVLQLKLYTYTTASRNRENLRMFSISV